MKSKKHKVLLVDDHQLFREGLKNLVNGFLDFEVVLEASDGLDLINKIDPQHVPDIALLDINMKPMDGFKTAQWLKQNYPTIKIMALSMYDNENAIIRMLRNGARGYLLKDIKKQELYEALSTLQLKGYYTSELVASNLIQAMNEFDQEGKSKRTDLLNLNQKEIEFLNLVCSELTYKEIAEKMSMSPYTIDGYRDALFNKLRVKSRVGLVLYAIRNRIFMIN